MIEVLIRKKETVITGFQISGHAGYDEAGKDIICSAVSILGINTVNAITRFTGDTVKENEMDEEKGWLRFRLSDVSKESELLFKTFELGVLDIEENYGKYLAVHYQEE